MLIFDLDGTLYKTHLTCLTVLKELCDKYRIEIEPEDENYLMYTTVASLLNKIAPNMSDNDRWNFEDEFKWREIELVSSCGELFEGVVDLLNYLKKKGHVLAICGMGSREYIDAVLDYCDIRKYFDYVYSRQKGKTKSQVLKQLICHSGEQKENCIMIGDSITDLTAAVDNNVPFIGVSYGYGSEDINTYTVAGSIEELKGLINQVSIFPSIYKDIILCKKPLIIGVDGVDTSGKTIFANNLRRFFEDLGQDTLLIHMDDFHNRRATRSRDSSPRGYMNNAFNTTLLSELLKSIQQGNVDLSLDLLDLDKDEYSNTKRFTANMSTITIIEGVLLYRPPIDQFINYKIFLDIDFNEVLHRAGVRDVPKYGEEFLEKYRNRYIPAQKIYLEEHFPKTNCDMLIDNNDYSNPCIQKRRWKNDSI